MLQLYRIGRSTTVEFLPGLLQVIKAINKRTDPGWGIVIKGWHLKDVYISENVLKCPVCVVKNHFHPILNRGKDDMYNTKLIVNNRMQECAFKHP